MWPRRGSGAPFILIIMRKLVRPNRIIKRIYFKVFFEKTILLFSQTGRKSTI